MTFKVPKIVRREQSQDNKLVDNFYLGMKEQTQQSSYFAQKVNFLSVA